MEIFNKYRSIIFPIVIFAAISIFYAIPLFENIENYGGMDWDQFVFWNAVPRLTMLKYHQFPLWNPYSNGGNVMLALMLFLCVVAFEGALRLAGYVFLARQERGEQGRT